MPEQILETKNCKNCGTEYTLTSEDLEFLETVSPVFDGKKYQIPAPLQCPNCRFQRRLCFRNERNLYKRQCDASGKTIISVYSPDKTFKVYDSKIWRSDKWDPFKFGRDFDFKKTFFEQFNELSQDVPVAGNMLFESENSDYCNLAMHTKNSYLVFSGRNNENCFYGRNLRNCTNCIDCLQIVNCENLYECNIAFNCMNVKNSFHIFNCSNSSYLYVCDGLSNCFACKNLNNKSYCIFNEQYSKLDYFKELDKLLSFDPKILQQKIEEFMLSKPNKNLYLRQNEDECSIDFIRNSKNVQYSLNIADCEDCKYCMEIEGSRNMSDITVSSSDNSLCYDALAIGAKSFKTCFTFLSTNLINTYYSGYCFNSNNLFGCIGLRNQQYCILNKQYSQKKYEELVAQIIEHIQYTGEWGEFFPITMSHFAYNESYAQEFFPLNYKEILGKGYNYIELEDSNYSGEVYKPLDIKQYNIEIVGKEIAEKNINEVMNGILKCEISGRPFKIIKQELDFYIKHNIQIPLIHSDERHKIRMKLRNMITVYDRNCDKCGVEIKTTYALERPEIIYCEKCYNTEVY